MEIRRYKFKGPRRDWTPVSKVLYGLDADLKLIQTLTLTLALNSDSEFSLVDLFQLWLWIQIFFL
uniref:Uncharacterized protein n=1 Tax=Rhizophagus irregularis (strain DAOM 181602 / DAOM 197198 / MUCL 43194) TaxID=747089 RepID=U9SNK3_RHIID